MRNIRILADARALGQRPSGIGVYIYNLARELHRRPGIEIELVTDVCESNEMKELREEGIRVYEFGKPAGKSFLLLSYFRYVQRGILKRKPDIFWEVNILSPLPLRNPYGHLVTTIHDMFPLQYPEHFAKSYPAYFRFGLNITSLCFDTFIYNSEETRRLSEQYFPGLRKKDNFVGYSVVPKLPEMPVCDNGSFFYCGNLETRKGTDILLKAFALYRKKGGARTLRLAGKVRDKEVQELLDDSEYQDGVSYLGYITEEERNQEYASCSCFVFPSRAEGFGVPVLEVMNYQKPVLVLDLSIYHEVAGECIGYVKAALGKEEEAFCDAMLSADSMKVEEESYRQVLERYLPETLGTLFEREFRALAEKQKNSASAENKRRRHRG